MASAAVQSEWMAGLCLPMTTFCLPTVLILHRGHWSGSYWFFLPFFFFNLSIFVSLSDLSALAKKIKLEAMASYHSNQQHGGPNGENGDHNPGLGESQPFVHPHTHAHETFHYGCITRRTVVVCTHLRCKVNTTWAAVFMCGCWNELIKTRMWHHLCCLYVSSERWWMKNKLQQQWVSSSDEIRNRHLGQVIRTIKSIRSRVFSLYIFCSLFQVVINAC